MTHRVFSRNAMSSRAVPVAKMIEQVRNDPAMPIHWGANQPGMQANGEIEHTAHAERLWRHAALDAARIAEHMMELGLHKQVANRVLEPYQWMHTVVTSTEWPNFFMLRRHEAAEPNIHMLADSMATEMEISEPQERAVHLPYIQDHEMVLFKDIMEAAIVSAARCARVSYLNHDGTRPVMDKDLGLATLLRDSKHASPFEHVAFAAGLETHSRNFIGWTQLREVIGL